MTHSRPQRKPPLFAYSQEGRDAYVTGWKERAAFYRREAGSPWLTANQRKLMLANAQAAETQANKWKAMGRHIGKAS